MTWLLKILKIYLEKQLLIKHYVMKHLTLIVSMVSKLLNKKSASNSFSAIKSEIKSNKQLAEELHKPIIRKSKKRRVYSSFKDNIWDADLVDMQIISKYDKRSYFLLRVIHIFSKMLGDFFKRYETYNSY